MTLVPGRPATVAGLRVTPATVLSVRAVIMEEVARLKLSMYQFQRDHQNGTMPQLGTDPVSAEAAAGFTETTQHLLAICRSDIDRLAHIGADLAQVARAYGITEQQITQSFDSAGVTYQRTPIPPSGDPR